MEIQFFPSPPLPFPVLRPALAQATLIYHREFKTLLGEDQSNMWPRFNAFNVGHALLKRSQSLLGDWIISYHIQEVQNRKNVVCNPFRWNHSPRWTRAVALPSSSVLVQSTIHHLQYTRRGAFVLLLSERRCLHRFVCAGARNLRATCWVTVTFLVWHSIEHTFA